VKVVTVSEMRALERAAMARGISEAMLMEEAGRGIGRHLLAEFPGAGKFFFLCGKGNNGGDGLVAARTLREAGREARCFSPFSLDDPMAEPMSAWPGQTPDGAVFIDALLGVGARGPLRGEIGDIARNIFGNARGSVAAIDIPTGVDADTGAAADDAVRADLTITCGFPKIGMFDASAPGYVGRVRVAPLSIPDDALAVLEGPEFFTDAEARRLLPRRAWSAHKGHFGHVVVIAGNVGTSGAAVMAIEGALHAGAGLVTAFVPEAAQPIVASCVMEAMVRPYRDVSECVGQLPEGAVCVIGPGLGVTDKVAALLGALAEGPASRMVLDADAITALARERSLLRCLNASTLLTPHPGEMRRLMGKEIGERVKACAEFSDLSRAALLLKGAYTIVSQSGRTTSFNSTGNPGMATGGMGDVLAGICGGLMAQGLDAHDAGRLGAFLHGRAGDLALRGQSHQSLLPRHLIEAMGPAFCSLA